MKRSFTILLVMTLLLSCCPAMSMQASAAVEGYYEYELEDSKATIYGYSGPGGNVIIPDTLGGYPVTAIGPCAFGGCDSLTSVVIPDSATIVDEAAFIHCPNLTSATIGNSVTEIGASAFEGCGLTSVMIPVSVTSIGWCAFFDCDKLTDVYYGGTEAQWSEIDIEMGNRYLTEATIHYGWNMSGEPDASADPGDLDGVEGVTEDDAIYLLQAILMPDMFPVEQDVDFDGNGTVNEDDAIYLLQHVLMPDMFPLQ